MKRVIFIIVLPLLFSLSVLSQERFRSGIFLHHSTGQRIWGPNGSSTSVLNEISKYNTARGYSGEEACSMSESWFPGNDIDNEWATWHEIFDNEKAGADISPYLSNNKIVMIKSCFPSSAMTGWGEWSDTLNPTRKSVYNYKWHWRHIIGIMASHPENFYVIWTNAPLVAGATNDDQAWWAHVFCTWAKDTLATGDDVFGAFPRNVYVFDFFHKLAGTDYKLKAEYASSSTDSHPNSAATELVDPQLVEEVFDAAIMYEQYYNGGLQPPVLSSPADHATDVALDATVTWSSVSGATGYHLQVSDTSDFSSLLIDVDKNDTSYAFGDELNDNTEYFWKVKAVSNDEESGWSSVWSFSTATNTSVKDLLLEKKWIIYPNPAKGRVTLSLKNSMKQGTLNVFNAQGRLVNKIVLKNNKTFIINLEFLLPGIYFLNISNDEFSSGCQKLIIDK